MDDDILKRWAHLRAHKWSKDPPPPEWDSAIKPISLEGLSLFGIHQRTGAIHWDGDEIVVRRGIKFDWYQTLLATIVAASALILALIELYRLLFVSG